MQNLTEEVRQAREKFSHWAGEYFMGEDSGSFFHDAYVSIDSEGKHKSAKVIQNAQMLFFGVGKLLPDTVLLGGAIHAAFFGGIPYYLLFSEAVRNGMSLTLREHIKRFMPSIEAYHIMHEADFQDCKRRHLQDGREPYERDPDWWREE